MLTPAAERRIKDLERSVEWLARQQRARAALVAQVGHVGQIRAVVLGEPLEAFGRAAADIWLPDGDDYEASGAEIQVEDFLGRGPADAGTSGLVVLVEDQWVIVELGPCRDTSTSTACEVRLTWIHFELLEQLQPGSSALAAVLSAAPAGVPLPSDPVQVVDMLGDKFGEPGHGGYAMWDPRRLQYEIWQLLC